MVKNLIVPGRQDFLGGNTWELRNLTKVNIVFGKNGCGKSLLFRKIVEENTHNRHYCNPEKAGEIKYNAGLVEEQQTGQKRFAKRNQNLSSNYYSQVISRIAAYLQKKGYFEDRSQLVTIEKIENFVNELLPNLSFKLLSESPYFELKYPDGTAASTASLSSGEKQLFGTGLDVILVCAIWKFEDEKGTFVLIDEPDAHLHPDFHNTFAKFLKLVTEEFETQIIIASHSTTLLASIGMAIKNECSVIFLNRQQSVFKAQIFTDMQLKLSSLLGGHALMGPLFGAPIILVEGDDDYQFWSDLPRHTNLNFSVLPCNGCDEVKKYQKDLERIFSSIHDSFKDEQYLGFAILDNDTPLPKENSHPQNYIKFLQIEALKIENLYLCDEVLNHLEEGQNWEKAQIKIKNEASNFGNKKEKLLSILECDRKKVDLKKLMIELQKILDPKNIKWSIRLSQALSKNLDNSESQLYEFLGKDFAKYLLQRS